MSKKKKNKDEGIFEGINIFDRSYIDEFIEKLVDGLNGNFEKEIREQIQKLRVEYKRDRQDAINTGITAKVEEKIKDWVCPRIPSWVNSDHLTALGVVAIFIVAAGFILGSYDRIYLLLVVLGLFLNWFGDSFDGSLARYRKKTRPNYGYYIDHMVDAIVIIIFSLGLGISAFVRIDLALLFAIMYMAFMIHVELVTFVQNTFKYSFGLVGPTEMRIFGVFITIYMYLAPIEYFRLFNWHISQYDIAFLIVSILMGIVLFVSILKKGVELDREDKKRWKV
jgi:phosphatidylglycerophosphate synthase